MVHEIFIIFKPCHFDGVEGMKNYFLLIKLMRDKYSLYSINEEQIFLTHHY